MAALLNKFLIKDGDKVIAGQKLLSLESTVPQAQLSSLQTNLASMTAEAKFYRSLLGQGSAEINPQQLAKLNVRPEIFALTKNRRSIVAENQLYRAELNGTKLANLTTEQSQRLQSSRTELISRMSFRSPRHRPSE